MVKAYRGPKHQKVTPEMKKEFKKLREEGLTYKQIAEKYGLTSSTIQYHLKEKTRRLVLERQNRYYREGRTWRQKNPEKWQKYSSSYHLERYNNDEEFRQRMIQHVKNYEQRKKILVDGGQ